MKKKFVAVLLTAAMLAGMLTCAASSGEQFGGYKLGDYENEILVMYKTGDFQVISVEGRLELLAELVRLHADSAVDFVQPNIKYRQSSKILGFNDTYVDFQWGFYNNGSFTPPGAVIHEEGYNTFYQSAYGRQDYFAGKNPFTGVMANTHSSFTGVDINATEAMEVYAPKTTTVIAVIDTGIDYRHEDLGDVFWRNADEIAENGIDDDNNGYVDDALGWNFYDDCQYTYIGKEDAHGTHCAGTIAATAGNEKGIAGLVSDGSVRIMSLKVLGEEAGLGSTGDVLEAIKYAQANGAHIINMSFASDTYDRAIMLAIAASDMLFVTASGNNGRDISTGGAYPACYDLPNIICVTAVSPDGLLYKNANFSVDRVDIAAPGDYIVGLYSDSGYAYMGGTSMAAPMVSATAAMVRNQNPSLDWSDIRDIILETATPMASLKRAVATGGLLNAGAAVKKAATAVTFDDITDHWAEDYIKAAVERGIFSGTGDNTFSPDATMNRAMLAVTLHRMAGSPAAKTLSAFPDVPADAYYAGAVAWASEKGVITGSDGKFDPEGLVTRQQTAAMLYRFAGVMGVSTTDRANLNSYRDAKDISSWALDAMKWTVAAGLISGRDNGRLDPSGTTTRAETATMLVRLDSIIEK
ncbi:MAG: S8 family serine peptidase [Oscillospiraceae bacterium]|nr:S8 family serine peptidase [Oscillospiraceae bacterium]